jgi:hypothetical protein
MLNAYSPVHYKAFAFISFFTLPEYNKCSPLLRRRKLLLSLVKMLLVLGVRNPQSIACGVWSLRFKDIA